MDTNYKTGKARSAIRWYWHDKGEKKQERVKQALEISASRPDCDWLKVDKNDFSGVYNAVPERDQLDSDINENLIVELYSK